ncbi:polyketide biosynthesis enoyl-CoA hydratase PksH [Paenibacillus shirakamiensis]|uniref:Polyketide biosynthesis enoyl-CoA hydratase PksH n=1 Tax=Paenibacillus shirakamiensis TaxID=1265935 RepID=A0ABS4JEN0_9BACL|nr:enoyl-CoA hydratase/isomerase [Paenibacillus shirakamiensis]MBP2000177.1 polyketide biosynthesis enoyl-CoA hydratase PksH [Paenibacillus shirakamiensis]
MNYETISVRYTDQICYLQMNRHEANNTINDQLVEECAHVLSSCQEKITIVVLEGLPKVFCMGADFENMYATLASGQPLENRPEPLYDLWLQLKHGSFISIAHVRGKVNAGGVGFVSACDIVIADDTAEFSLSELLFGLFPACVMPFLIQRIGTQKTHYMTLMTKPISVVDAYDWGLVDAYDSQSELLIRKHLLRLKKLSKSAIKNYKRYLRSFQQQVYTSKLSALSANESMFSDPQILDKIYRFVEKGQFPWEE